MKRPKNVEETSS